LHDEGQHETFETETFEAKSKKGFEWEYWDYGNEKAEQSYGKYAGENTIKPAVQKAQKEGWKKVSMTAKYGPKIWGLMAQSPQWKPWVKDLTARCKYERNIMGETIDVFNGTAYWKKPGQYNPDHMGEDGGWEILTKDNKILLFYYYSDDELSTRLMRKTFTVPKAPARKPAAKKTTTRKSKPKAKSGRKGPDISATKRKIGTRMRGNDGNMWEVKPAGKSQRWVRGAETFEAPKTMTPLQAKNKFIALAQPYWIKALTKLKEGYIQEKKDDDKRRGGESEYFQQYDYDIEDTNTYLMIAKSPSKIKNIIGCDEGDTVLREMIPDGFYHLINYPREDYYTWENTMFYFEGPKAIQKQLKALLPIIKGKVTVKPKTTKKTTTRKAKPKAKAGRKAPTISATKRKIGTRMRGNDGKMWEVKKSGKSQRWMAGAESEAESAYSEPDFKGHNVCVECGSDEIPLSSTDGGTQGLMDYYFNCSNCNFGWFVAVRDETNEDEPNTVNVSYEGPFREPIPEAFFDAEGDTSNSFPVIPVLGGVLLLGALRWLNKN
jgi:hypothetical protein